MAAEYLEDAKYFWKTVDTQSILTSELFSFPHLQPEDILVWVISSVICWALKFWMAHGLCLHLFQNLLCPCRRGVVGSN